MVVKCARPLNVILGSMGRNMENRENIDAVKRMQDYIEKHITEPITLRMIARAAGYSPWHSARIFKELTGKTPSASST